MIIFTRSDNKPVQTTRHLNENIDMNGKYIVDFPDCIKIDRLDGTPLEIVSREIEPQFLKQYPSYDHVIYNPIIDNYNFLDGSENFPFTTGQTASRYKIGETPNTFAVLPVNASTSWKGVAVTQSIDISNITDDGLGRETFLLYWRAVKKVISHDQSPLSATPSFNGKENNPSRMKYVEAEEDSQYSVYISNNDGNTYELAKRLTPVSFEERAENVRIAFVNHSSDDIFFLSYALMF